MNKKWLYCFLIMFLCTACTSMKENVIEYGSEFDIRSYLKLGQEEQLNSDISIDTKVIGTYVIKGTVKKGDKEVKEVREELVVKDTELPQIKTIQLTNKVYEIPLHDSFQPLGNIEMISDSVDGEYKEIIIVNETEYNDIKKHVSELKEQANKNVFQTNEEVEVYKNSKEKSGYSLLYTNVDTNHAGTYEIHIVSIDCNYNTKELTYKVKVLEDGQQVSEGMLAAGTSTSKMSDISKFSITDHTKKETTSNQEETEKEQTSTDEVKTFESNIVSSNSVSSQGSPVLQSALNMVGSHMMCDDLVTTALVNAGMITGEAPSIFMNGSLYNIGVYQFPSVGQFISAGEAVPGDLVYYDNGGYGSSHIAVYAGNGQAVHGGWNGMNVVVSTVNIGSGPRYMRFSPMTWSDLSITVFGYDVNEKPSDTIPPSDEWIPSGDAPQDPQETPEINWGDEIDWGEPGTTYSTQSTVNDVTIAVSSTSPIDQEFVAAQTEAYANGEITYEEVVSNLQAKGYTIIDPF